MAVYLIRHGQSTVNAANVEANYSGLVYHEEQYWDAPLNETGVSQAREAAKQFTSSATDQGCVTSTRFRLGLCIWFREPIFWYLLHILIQMILDRPN